jgi:uncharacterized membrane protein
MRWITVLILVSILTLSAVLPVATPNDLEQSTKETSGRALVDFAVTGISFGNGTSPTQTWTQSDMSTVEYILKSQSIELNVTFQQAGQDFSTKTAMSTIEVWHPIGFMVTAWSFNITLSGGQTAYESVTWSPDAAHSILDANGSLAGGYSIRGTVDAGTLDTNEANDMLEKTLPVSIYASKTDSAVCGDPDGDGNANCPNQLMAGSPQFVSLGYDATDVVDNLGHWQADSSGGAEGSTRHFRASTPGASSYSANRNDRFHFAWFSSLAGTCDEPGHGLGYGQYNDALTQSYGNTVCTVQIQGYDYVSLQAYSLAWGDIGNGDQFALEANTGIEKQYYNMSDAGISATADDWTPVIWDMTDVFSNTNFGFNFLFKSDNLGATRGVHFDTIRFFGVEKVSNYTVDLSCNDPNPSPYVVIPADPNPPSLLCTLTNNGYNTIHITVRTEVDKASWMSQYPLRIDSTNIGDHDNTVSIEPIIAGNSTDFYVNLTIPAGVDVQTVNWSMWLNDTQTGFSKEQLHMVVNVDSSFSAELRQKTLANPAATLAPGESGNVTMKLRNTGNQPATWALGGYFDDELWGAGNLKWFDSDGMEIDRKQVNRSDEVEVTAQFTAPLDAVPGIVEVSLVANGVSPASSQATKKIYIDVPVVRNLVLTPIVTEYEAAANSLTRTISVVLTNEGNSEQAYDLILEADWHLMGTMSISATNPLQPFGGTATVLVVLPMPYGLNPDLYQLKVKATSKDGSGYSSSTQIMLTIPMTFQVDVEDLNMTGQTFRGGDEAKTVGWEITNLGNEQDAFTISTTQTEGMNVELLGLTNDNTPYIEPGESYELTVKYWFDDDSNGEKDLELTATSVEGAAVGEDSSSSGSATFQVGSQGWVTLESTGAITIDDYGKFQIQMQIHNRHPVDEQQIRLDVDRNSEFFTDGFSASIQSNEFSLAPDGQRLITVELTIYQTALTNLPSETMSYNITIEAEGGLDVVEAEQQITIHRLVIIDESAEESSLGGTVLKFGGIGFGVILIIVLLVAFVRIIGSTVRIEDEITSLEDYETSLGVKYGESASPAAAIPSAPSILPAADEVANSMYGGSEEIFKQRVAAPPPVTGIAAPPPAAQTGTAAPPPAAATGGAPPVPASGLPDGWTTDQWQHYGQQWLEQQGLA